MSIHELALAQAKLLLPIFAECPRRGKIAYLDAIMSYIGKTGRIITTQAKIKAMMRPIMEAMITYDDEKHITQQHGKPRSERDYVFASPMALSPALSIANKAEMSKTRDASQKNGRLDVANASGLMDHLETMAKHFPAWKTDRDTVWAAFSLLTLVIGCRQNEIHRCGTRPYIPIRSDFEVFANGTCKISSGSRVRPKPGEPVQPRPFYYKVVHIDPVSVNKLLDYVFDNIDKLNADVLYLNGKKQGVSHFKLILRTTGLDQYIKERPGFNMTGRALRSLSASLFCWVHDSKTMLDQITANRVAVSLFLGHDMGSMSCTEGYLSNKLSGTTMRPRTRVMLHTDKKLCVCFVCLEECTCDRPSIPLGRVPNLDELSEIVVV